jgi:hypothetical protein
MVSAPPTVCPPPIRQRALHHQVQPYSMGPRKKETQGAWVVPSVKNKKRVEELGVPDRHPSSSHHHVDSMPLSPWLQAADGTFRVIVVTG